jgi:hypothetical protein
MIYEDNDQKFSPQKISIPVFRPLMRVQTNQSAYKDAILKELEKYPLKESPLPAYLELSLTDYSTSGIEEIRQYLEELPIELINSYALTSTQNTEDEKEINITHIAEKSTPELFSLFLESFDLADNEKQELKKSFDFLLDEHFKEENSQEYAAPSDDNVQDFPSNPGEEK